MICEILNGGLLSRDVGDDDTRGASLTVVWAEIADTVQIHPGYGEQWGVSDVTAMALVTKLQTAPYADLVALVDFVERFWADDPEAHKVIYPEPEPAS